MFRPGIIVRQLIFYFTKHRYPDYRHTLLRILNNTDCKILESSNSFLTQTLVFGSISFDTELNTLILNASINYKDSKKFFLKKILVFLIQSFNPFRISILLLYLSLFFFILIYYFQFIFFCCTTRYPRFLVPGDFDFLLHNVVYQCLYI